MAAITDLAALTAIAVGDYFPVYDASAATDKKIAYSDLIGAQGTWTPTITGSTSNPTITYSTQSGTYRIVGTGSIQIVIAYFYIYATAVSGGSGDLRVSLPVASTMTMYSGSLGFASLAGKNVTNLQIVSSASYCVCRYYSASNGTTAAAQISDMPAGGGYLIGTAVYF